MNLHDGKKTKSCNQSITQTGDKMENLQKSQTYLSETKSDQDRKMFKNPLRVKSDLKKKHDKVHIKKEIMQKHPIDSNSI